MDVRQARVIDHHHFPALLAVLGRVQRGDSGSDVAALLDRTQTLAVVLEDLRDAEFILLEHAARAASATALSLGGGGKARGSALLVGSFQQYLQLTTDLKAEHGSLGEVASAIRGAIYHYRERSFTLPLPNGEELRLGRRALVMGILNVTPDSFSDGGRHLDPDRAVERARQMVAEGADLIDIGGESTRPGAEPVTAKEEQARILPVIERVARDFGTFVSVDTRHGATAREALKAGATIVNDISGLDDPLMGGVVGRSGAPLILMHMRGTPADMSEHTTYEDVVRETAAELAARMARAVAAGVDEGQIILDPGIGFAKTAEQSLEVLRHLAELRTLGRPLLVGPSRKSFLAKVRDVPAEERLNLTLGAVIAAVANGAHIVRVHDVRPAVDAIRAFEAARI